MQTEPFRMSGKDFIGIAVGLYSLPWLLPFAFLLVAALIAGVLIDLRWMIVFLMLLFIVLPMIVAFFYFNYGLREVTVYNSVEHRLLFGDDTLSFSVCRGDEEEVVKEIVYADFSGYYTGKNCVVVPLKQKVRGFVWIPVNSFSSFEDFRESVELLSGINRNKGDENIKGEK
ncbi:MAG: hypothetical protein K2M10_06935 [Muribaculaceae bacterium]|nr:hypothetical protein [Muribaculaceae bacterium]